MNKLWAITSLFNPAGYARRLQNYGVFMKNLTVPLATVELSYDGRFVLEDGDADLLIRLQAQDVMWQKERLLNLLIEALPDTCEYVAWLDCDVIFEKRDWPAQAAEALQKYAILQLFDQRRDLPPEATEKNLPEQAEDYTPELIRPSSGLHIVEGGPVTDDFSRTTGQAKTTTGLAWAGRRALLQKHCLYDACIIGGGDRVNLAAAMGWFDLAMQFHKITGRRREHYLSWARPFHESVQGRVGYIPGRLYHLWHGDLKDRGYVRRFGILSDHDFDPYTDIALDDQGIWKWASGKPELHRRMREYFASRNEDGRRVETPTGTPA